MRANSTAFIPGWKYYGNNEAIGSHRLEVSRNQSTAELLQASVDCEDPITASCR